MNKARTMAFRNENAIIRGGKVVYKEIIDPPALDDYNENPQ